MRRLRPMFIAICWLTVLAPAAYGQTRGGFDGKGHLLMHGTPRFVLGVYDSGGADSTDPAYWEKAIFAPAGARGLQGFPLNVYLNYWLGGMPIGPTTALLDVLNNHGLMYLATGNCFDTGSWTRYGPGSFSIMDQSYVQQFAQHPAALGYYIMDECADALIPETQQHHQQLQTWDPQGISFGATLAAAYRDPSLWKDTMDIMGIDPYPLYGAEPAAGYAHFIVADFTAKLRAAAKPTLPVWTVLQFFKFTSDSRLPTAGELRTHAVMAIVEGAQGLFWWDIGVNGLRQLDAATVSMAMSQLNTLTSELAGLEPVLLAPSADGALVGNTTRFSDPVAGRIAQLQHNIAVETLYSRIQADQAEVAALQAGDTSKSPLLAGAANVRTRTKIVNGVGYVFAYNYTNLQQPVTFTWQSVPTSVKESRSGQSYPVNGASWSDTFGPYEARIYLVNGAGGLTELNTSPCKDPDFVFEFIQKDGNAIFAVAGDKVCVFFFDPGPPPKLTLVTGLLGLSSPAAAAATEVGSSPLATFGVWATLSSNKIARITTDGTASGTAVTEFPIPTPNSQPDGITPGPDGNMWFTESTGNNIGRITRGGTITEFPLPTPNSGPSGITWGPDGNLWFTETSGRRIGKMTPDGVFTEFPAIIGFPQSITPGPDNNLWVAAGANIIRVTPSGAQTAFSVPSGSFASRITNGPDGNLYFVGQNLTTIGQITTGGVISTAILPTPNAGTFGISTGDDGALYVAERTANQLARVLPVAGGPNVLAATLPPSRSVQVGSNATAFATILNTGPGTATGCSIVPITHVPGNFLYQTTDPHTNQLIGTPNTPVDIPANALQTFLIAFRANGPFVPTNALFGYSCTNANSAAVIIGVNTLLLTFSPTPVPDVIAVGLTPSNDGFSHTGGPSGTGVFVIAATDIGAAGTLTARARVSDAAMPLTTMVCETDPQTGQCKAPPAPTLTRAIGHNEDTTWTAFLTATGPIAPDPARFRVFFEFVDPNGIVRGSTSTAVTTQ